MNEAKIIELIANLTNKEVSYKSYDGTMSKTKLIQRGDGLIILEQMIRQALLEGREEEKGIMEAKLFTYEQIISKSNFAPLLEVGKKIKENLEVDNSTLTKY